MKDEPKQLLKNVFTQYNLFNLEEEEGITPETLLDVEFEEQLFVWDDEVI